MGGLLTLGGIILKILIILIQTQTNNTKKDKKSDSFKEDKRRGNTKIEEECNRNYKKENSYSSHRRQLSAVTKMKSYMENLANKPCIDLIRSFSMDENRL